MKKKEEFIDDKSNELLIKKGFKMYELYIMKRQVELHSITGNCMKGVKNCKGLDFKPDGIMS